MTGFLGERSAVGVRDFGQQTEAWKGPQTGLWESMQARTDAAAIGKNTSGVFDELDEKRVVDALAPFSERLYGDPLAWRLYPEHRRLSPSAEMVLMGVGQAALMPHDMAVDLFFAEMAAARKQDPEVWKDAPPDRKTVEAQVRSALQREHADAAKVIARDRDRPWVPDQTLKDLAVEARTPMPEELPFLLAGGGASLLARMGWSAVWGAAGEAVVHPQMKQQAEYLDIKPPDLVENMTMAAGASAAFPLLGAALRGGARMTTAEGRAEMFGGWRSQASSPEDAAALTKAEAALASGRPELLPETPPPAPPSRPQMTPALVEAVIWQESKNGLLIKGPDLKNDDGTMENAWGLMQIRPSTARDPGFGVQGLTGSDGEIIAQLQDPVVNRRLGEAYLQAMLNRYDHLEDALVAYNWGPGKADKWIDAGRPTNGLPTQTRDYVRSIRQRLNTQGQAAPSAPMDWDRPARAANSGGVILPPQMTTPTGTKVDVTYEVLDLAQLRAAAGELQPRDRTRAGSREQIAQMAADLDPYQLMPSPRVGDGAPLIGPDDIVESGNGRIAAIRLAAESPETGKYAAYLDHLRDMGFELPATGQPVLVARRRTALDEAGRRALVIEANASPVMRFSPTEQALVDAEAVPMSLLAQFEDGAQIFGEKGRVFVQTMFARLPQSERNAFYPPKEGLNDLGRRRIEAAIFARAYEAPDLIAALTETPDAASTGLVRALTEAAPQWASLRHGIEAGRIDPQFDLTADLVGAVRTITSARRDAAAQKRPVATVLDEAMRQGDFERGTPGPAQRMLVEAFYDGGRARASHDAAAILRNFVETARSHGSAEPDLFGARPPPSVLEALARGAQRAEAEIDAPTARADADADADADGDLLFAPESDALGDLTQPPPAPAEPGSMEELKALVARGAPAEVLEAHPAVRRALEEMDAIPRTDLVEGFGTPEWRAVRRYRAGDLELDADSTVAHLEASARTLAWTDEKLTPPANPTRAERRAFIVVGPPAAGKSTIANPLARKWGAAIVDADEAKKVIPEFRGGVGANAVHEESGDLIKDVQDRFMESGANMVLPKVGGSLASIDRQIADLKARGYHVSVVNMRVPAEEAYRRMFGRFVNTGRLINPAYVREVGDKPNTTYLTLKERNAADDFVEIDNSGGFGDPKPIDDPSGLFSGSGLRTQPLSEPADFRTDGGGGDAELGASGAAPRGTPREGSKRVESADDAEIDKSGVFGDSKPIDDPAGLFDGSGLRTTPLSADGLRGDGGDRGTPRRGVEPTRGGSPDEAVGAGDTSETLTPPPRVVPTQEAAMRQPAAMVRYSDPDSAEAAATADAHMRELRDQALADPEFAALELTDAEGKPLLDAEGAPLRGADGQPLTVAGLLADLDADETLATAVKFCGRTRG